MFDYHALLPELILGATLLVVLGVDLVVAPRRRWLAGAAGIVGLLAAAVPLLTLANCGPPGAPGRGRCSAGRTWWTTSPWCSRACSWWPAPSCCWPR